MYHRRWYTMYDLSTYLTSLARIMGHADSKQVLRMLQRELKSLEEQDAYYVLY
jgi:transposase-like protein